MSNYKTTEQRDNGWSRKSHTRKQERITDRETREEIAAASTRIESLHFGVADYAASTQARTVTPMAASSQGRAAKAMR